MMGAVGRRPRTRRTADRTDCPSGLQRGCNKKRVGQSPAGGGDSRPPQYRGNVTTVSFSCRVASPPPSWCARFHGPLPFPKPVFAVFAKAWHFLSPQSLQPLFLEARTVSHGGGEDTSFLGCHDGVVFWKEWKASMSIGELLLHPFLIASIVGDSAFGTAARPIAISMDCTVFRNTGVCFCIRPEGIPHPAAP